MKRALLTAHFNLEALFNNVNTRLKEGEHPQFVAPSPEISIEQLGVRIRNLHVLEQVEVALNAEVNRQSQLAQLEQQHAVASDKIIQWCNAQIRAIVTAPQPTSSGEARSLLKLLEAVQKV